MIFNRKNVAGALVGGMIAVAGIVGPAPTSVVAQETYSETHLNHVREVLRELQLFNSFDQIIPSMAERARALFVKNNPALASEIEESVTNAALSLVERRAALDKQVIEIWASRFSEDEIRAISEFFGSPAGQKFAAQSGDLLQESAVAAKLWGDQLSVDIIDMVRKDLGEQGKPTE